jgi:hypothetical protein
MTLDKTRDASIEIELSNIVSILFFKKTISFFDVLQLLEDIVLHMCTIDM